MNKLFTKVATLSIGLAMAIGVGVAVGSGRKAARVHAADTLSYTIAMKDTGTSSDGTSAKTTINDLISSGSDYVSSVTASKMYQAKSGFGVKGGSSSAKGSLTLSLSSSGQVNASKITLSLAMYDSGKTVKVTVNGSSTSTISPSTSLDNYDVTVGETLTSITVESTNASKNRFYLNSINVYTASSKSLSSIALSGTYPTSFTQGDEFSHTGMTVTATYSDASTADVSSSASWSGYNMSTTGNQTVTVSYTESGTTKTDTYTITVNAPKTPASLATTGQTTSFETGNTFTYGGTSTVTYTDSTDKSVTPSSFKIGNAGINPISAGTVIVPGTTVLNRNDHHGKTVYVLYEENSTTVYASYTISVAAISKISFVGGTDTGTASGQGQSDTLTKSGISMSCDSCYTTSGAYRFYSGSTLTISSTVGNIAKIEFNMNGSYNSNLLSTSTGTYNYDDSSKGVWTGDAASIAFDLGAQARCDSVDITLASNDPLVELAPASSTEVSMLKGDTDTSIKVLVKNIETKTWSFTFDEDEEEGISTSSYINVSAGDAVSDVHTLTITTKAVGSTIFHISVSGTACAASIPVTVAAKPASMTIVHSDISEGEIEIITGAYKQVSFSGLDTDGNPYSIAAADVTPSATSGASHVTLSGTRITGASEGTAVVRYTLNALTSVYAEITVHVVDDYIESVGEPTFATGLTDTQGQSPTVSVFTSRPGTMHSGSSTTVPFENYKFSYTESYADAEYGSVFSYDFSHGTTVDSTHKTQTIYVFCDIDEAAHGSFTVTVEQLNDPLTAITFTNVTNNEVDVVRGNTFQLEWAYTPTNPTDGKEVEFIIDDNSEGIDITVSELGLISIGASSGLGTALVLIQSAHDDTIQDYVYVTAKLESMTYTVSETESLTPVSTVSSGDRVYMIGTATDHNNQTYEFNGYPGTYGGATEYTTSVAKLQLLVVEAGTESGTVSFKLSGGDNDGEYISYSGSSNTLNHTSTKDASASWTVDGSTITNANTDARQIWLNWNNGTPRFACYTNKTSTTGYYCPTFIKVTGGDTEYDVTETLFNGVHNNFGGEGATYEWDASCASFDSGAWEDACDALKGITGYSTYKLNRAVGNMAGNEIEVFLAKYDAIVRKFGTSHDHLDRFSSDGINASIKIVNTFNIVKGNSTAVIIIVASAIGLAAVGGYFFLRKKER